MLFSSNIVNHCVDLGPYGKQGNPRGEMFRNTHFIECGCENGDKRRICLRAEVLIRHRWDDKKVLGLTGQLGLRGA